MAPAAASVQAAEPETALESEVRKTYTALCDKLRELSRLNGISGILYWDEQVMMPKESSAIRAHQKEALAGVLHEKSTSKELGALLDTLTGPGADLSELSEWERANVVLAKRDYDKATKIPKELQLRKAVLETEAYNAWAKARETGDFELFAPKLQDWIALRKEIAQCIDPSRPVYDVLIDEYERNCDSSALDTVFAQLKEGLIPMVEKIVAGFEKRAELNKSFIKGDAPKDVQKTLNDRVAKDIGFDFDKGRLDLSVHPFTGGAGPHDVRMTTRFSEANLFDGLMGTIHESGHALYEQGRNPDFGDLPVSEALSMGIHESQSLLWERMVGLSLPFWQRYGGVVMELFPSTFAPDSAPEDFWRFVNTVKRSFIRVEADEVTYPLHIILRFEMERDLLSGTLAVSDVPRVWAEKFKHYIGLTPPDDKVGCLQDIHWGIGLFGYFPTYLLGAMSAVQIYDTAAKHIPDLDSKIRAGDFAPLKAWLNDSVHKSGSLHSSGADLMTAVTGRPLDADVFLTHIRKKYSAILGEEI